MAIFNDNVRLADGTFRNIKIPGNSDMTLYLDRGSVATNYRLGNDGCFYNRRSGAKVASAMSISQFANLHISWILEELYFNNIVLLYFIFWIIYNFKHNLLNIYIK